MSDPWKHRSEGMLCKTCMWYVGKTIRGFEVVPGSTAPIQVDLPGKVGRCRRHAPTMNGYPVVFPTDWCGDHKLNENTL